MNRPRWEALEHTSDLELLIFAESEQELFENTALALMSQIVELDTVSERKSIDICVEEENGDQKELFLDWLRELVFLSITRGFLVRNLNVELVRDKVCRKVNAKVRGEYIDQARHQLLHEVKTVTYQDFFYGREGTTWKARVVFDV